MLYHYKGKCSSCERNIEISSSEPSTTCVFCHGTDQKARESFRTVAYGSTVTWTEKDVEGERQLLKYRIWDGEGNRELNYQPK